MALKNSSPLSFWQAWPCWGLPNVTTTIITTITRRHRTWIIPTKAMMGTASAIGVS
jgi:hypothetical protein